MKLPASNSPLLDLACAIVQQAMRDLKDGRRYTSDEMDPGEWLRQAGMLRLAEQALMEKE